ncbi:hypothetical protein SAICODRAFT_64651 [Saitoella complicata NRRL Y-17804]|uniref:Uncharacterized protein n=1 Tax=Saitoella complicata (strain BCRC 22490 / CBS 7301 / JCM 7358 / NBRC 10748 / NRRL Y-17804) TaxID=698492 RepID=A0A0E9N7B9_SAICN|nr:uncharacterized protein SAICODRAFT_64651 [Saitoella complicata NRRL Y-17804]ODQ54373.1 hypothetical protein SAICODRAFT_64651 [Saitoella complicata NRRL Y-17804]GAO45832.1 hypothetical protein G7K_0081-t1 [Saitoella complicata NRRL Y-17804]
MPSNASLTPAQQREAEERILRRVEISKMSRNLKTRLNLAMYKTQRGWENLPLAAIEPKVAAESARRKESSSGESPTRTSDSEFLVPGLPSPSKRRILGLADGDRLPPISLPYEKPRSATKRIRRSSATEHTDHLFNTAWQNSQRLNHSQSSPIRRPQPGVDSDPPSDLVLGSSPPRTPPRKASFRPNGMKETEEGADLLLFLATSPSPATGTIQRHHTNSSMPPTSSPMIAPQTPGNGFNFADYVNINTPSPGGMFARTPGTIRNARTPVGTGWTPGGVTPSARRKLNFDSAGILGSPARANIGVPLELGAELNRELSKA